MFLIPEDFHNSKSPPRCCTAKGGGEGRGGVMRLAHATKYGNCGQFPLIFIEVIFYTYQLDVQKLRIEVQKTAIAGCRIMQTACGVLCVRKTI